MSQGTSEFELIYNEGQNPLIREFNVTELKVGLMYQFKVAAINFNGDSQLSDALVKYSCQLPSEPQPPFRFAGNRTQLTLRWQIPTEDGGCPLIGFNLFGNDGVGGSINMEINPTEINNRPSLTYYAINFDPTDTGKQFRY